jgi:hypothetical protein
LLKQAKFSPVVASFTVKQRLSTPATVRPPASVTLMFSLKPPRVLSSENTFAVSGFESAFPLMHWPPVLPDGSFEQV